MQHLVSIDDLTKSDIDILFHRVEDIKNNLRKFKYLLHDKILANLFYEPSTRTSSSFAAAMFKLGGNVISINDVNYSSVSKGENLYDTIKTMSCYADVIVLRSKNAGDALLASEVSEVPIINAGDGNGEHPTQTLLDLYTIWEKKKTLRDLTITFAGDIVNGRTVHSLSKFLEKDNECLYCETYENLTPYLNSDVLYMTRVQKERGSKGSYEITDDQLDILSKDCIVMHPFPRNKEIPKWFDSDSRAVYFRQIKNGLYMRMAILMSYK